MVLSFEEAASITLYLSFSQLKYNRFSIYLPSNCDDFILHKTQSEQNLSVGMTQEQACDTILSVFLCVRSMNTKLKQKKEKCVPKFEQNENHWTNTLNKEHSFSMLVL